MLAGTVRDTAEEPQLELPEGTSKVTLPDVSPEMIVAHACTSVEEELAAVYVVPTTEHEPQAMAFHAISSK